MSSPEILSEVTREQVIEAFQKFVQRGVTHPAELDYADEEVIEANAIHNAWVDQEIEAVLQAGPDQDEVRLLKEFEITTIFVDAGFSDTEFLKDVTYEWLSQTLWRAEAAGLYRVADKIETKIDEINEMIELQTRSLSV